MKRTDEKKYELPERLYYPIDIAAQKLHCSARDIFHYAATESLRLCFYCDIVPDENIGQMVMNVPFGFHEDIGNATDIVDEHWRISISNIINKDGDFGRGYNVEKVKGFFYIGPIDCIDLEFTDEDDYFSVSGISTEPDITSEEALVVLFEKDFRISKRFLCVMAEQLEDIKQEPSFPSMDESGKTVAKKGELIKCLLRLIDDMSDVDFDNTPVSKIVNIIEATAARKGVDLPETHRQTWQKYLGR
ncbi:hypothetical protein J9881_21075 [Escherichia coli]|uniref:hypothetical protein n=1 Tax=Escherichia coli TaxID=562 RepID=UPI001B31A7E2|nr:hypothetical protein [Escherichia coli]MBP4006540.1 hypothetical protein [Escherichia coli]